MAKQSFPLYGTERNSSRSGTADIENNSLYPLNHRQPNNPTHCMEHKGIITLWNREEFITPKISQGAKQPHSFYILNTGGRKGGREGGRERERLWFREEFTTPSKRQVAKQSNLLYRTKDTSSKIIIRLDIHFRNS